MKNYFIIHGSYGHSKENWFPWLEEKIKQKGYDVFNFNYPTPNGQNFENWSKVLDQVKDKINEFYSLDLLSQSEQLYNIIKRVAPGNFNANLALIGESPNAAKILLNKDIANKNIKLIIRSATGLQQKIISL